MTLLPFLISPYRHEVNRLILLAASFKFKIGAMTRSGMNKVPLGIFMAATWHTTLSPAPLNQLQTRKALERRKQSLLIESLRNGSWEQLPHRRAKRSAEHDKDKSSISQVFGQAVAGCLLNATKSACRLPHPMGRGLAQCQVAPRSGWEFVRMACGFRPN